MIKRNALLGTVAAASLVTLAACGGGTAEAPAEDTTEEVVEEETVEEEAVEEEVAAVPQAEANGTVHEIQMLTRDPETGRQVFSPMIVNAKVGDTIKFIATDPTHLAASIDDMLPAGVTGFEGKVNEEVEYVISAPGVYGYKCTPHYGAGMVGLIVVEGEGMEDNVAAAKEVSHPGLARTVFPELFTEAGL